ncbi:MAG TPA: YtxH domain-containing protein [Amnibacterium sp.]|jgi:oxygen-dependent protoporphyrinogen oxidase|uniref:YtxH domain-containing protein n=1 Tax=Amnibacterium sp. TaxID=1872496 RepID=UPI002F9213C6
MQGRIVFLAGAAVGYVLGARAGRRRYEQIKAATERLWNDEKVQNRVDQVVGSVQGFVKDKAPEVQDAVLGGAKKVVSQVTKRKSDADAA